MSQIGGFDSSIRGIQSGQAPAISGEQRTERKPVEQHTNSIGLQAIHLQEVESASIKDAVDLVMHGGSSPADAPCRKAGHALKECISAHQLFRSGSAGEAAPAQRTEQRSPSDTPLRKLSTSEMPQTLSVATAAVEKGTLGPAEGALVLQQGRLLESNNQTWLARIADTVRSDEARLPTASSSEKPVIEVRIREAKALLKEVQANLQSISGENGKLEQALVSKFGKASLDAPLPQVSSGGQPVVHQLYRRR